MSDCDHKIEGQNGEIDAELIGSYCPRCGTFFKNLFIGQPQNIKPKTPLEILVNKIYRERKTKGEIKKIRHGPETLENILKPIRESEICVFDITGEIFNVAYEMGFALGYSTRQCASSGTTEINKKYIILLRDLRTNPKDYIFRNMDLKDTVPQTKSFLKAVNSYSKGKKIEITISNVTIFNLFLKYLYNYIRNRKMENDISRCEKEIINSIFETDIVGITSRTWKFVGWKKSVDNFEKNILLITNSKFKEDFEKLNDCSKLNCNLKIETPDQLFNPIRDMRYFLKKINNNLISNYSKVIIHLLGGEIDGMDEEESKKHNFKAGVISGIMDGFHDDDAISHSYFLKNLKTDEKFLRCSDIFTDVRTYNSTQKDMISKTKEIILELSNN